MPRTRTIGPTKTTGAVSATRFTTTYNGTTTTTQVTPTTGTVEKTYLYKTMVDTVTPNFERIKREGGIVNNNMTQSTYLGVVTPLLISYSAKWSQSNPPYTNPKWITDSASGELSTYTQGLGDADSILGSCTEPTLPSLNTGAAVAAAYGQMAKTPLNLWVTAMEFRETIQTVATTLAAINKLMRFRAHDLIGSKGVLAASTRGKPLWEVLSTFPEVWLHVRYGLRPLFYELKGALEALRLMNTKARQRFSSHVFLESDARSSSIYLRTYGTMTYRTQLTKTLERRTTGGLLAELISDDLTLPHLLGVGNGLEAIWDLVPYSFVVDWFFNIADLMSVWNPNPYIHAKATWVVSTEYLTYEHKVVPELGVSFPVQYTYPLVESAGYAYGGVRYTKKFVQRIAEPARPVFPSLRATGLSVPKVIDLLALSRGFKKLLAS